MSIKNLRKECLCLDPRDLRKETDILFLTSYPLAEKESRCSDTWLEASKNRAIKLRLPSKILKNNYPLNLDVTSKLFEC